MSVVCYTSIYGGYDQLKAHPDHPGIRAWVAYTDNPDLQCDGWDVVVEPARFEHPRLSAKWRKCHPPTEYDASIWIDGSMLIHDPQFFDAMLEGLAEADMVMFPHPDRTSVIAEAEVSTRMVKYRDLPVMSQAQTYVWSWGWRDDTLWASTTMARWHRPHVLQMGAAWFGECQNRTYQDQLSLPPLVDRYQVSVSSLPYSLWRNPWFGLRGHASDL
jgi:hypothetical protein